MVIAAAAASSNYLGHSPCLYCHAEGIGCSTSAGVSSSWIKPPLDVQMFSDHSGTSFRCKNTFLGDSHFNWLPFGHENCLSKVSVAADYPDSVPDSSDFLGNQKYHPLEELKERKRVRKTRLTSAEVAKTVVEANSSALLLFPGTVHCEPHEHVSWSQFLYVIDEYGDIFFEIYDDKNILEDPGASNPVNVLIGTHNPLSANRRAAAAEFGNSDVGFSADYYFETKDSEMADMLLEWEMLDSFSSVHPVYFAKCLTKAISMEHAIYMDHPSDGVSIVGWIRPAYIDEEVYIRLLFKGEAGEGYSSDWEDKRFRSLNSESGRNPSESTIYRLEIMSIELTSVYGIQSAISVRDFREAEPDVLVHSTSTIVKHFVDQGIRSKFALAAFCKKKGLNVEGANLIGVDSLGMDVRIFSGIEVGTHRFPFRARATSEIAAEKQIQQLLFPRSRRKRHNMRADRHKDTHPL